MSNHYSHTTLEQAEKTLYFILDIINEGIWDWNAKNGKVIRSAGWFRMLGYPIGELPEDVITWENIIHPEDYQRVMAHFEDYLEGRCDVYRIQYRCKKSDGDYLWVEDSGKIVERSTTGKVMRMIGAHSNIHDLKTALIELEEKNQLLSSDNAKLKALTKNHTSKLQHLNQQLEQKVQTAEYNANHDMLTGLFNRRRFEEQLEIEIQRTQRYQQPLSLMLLDIDYFKLINDRLGHKTGDLALQKLAQLLNAHTRSNDFPARWGGEEFIIILPNTDLSAALRDAERLRREIADAELLPNLKLTCSFGVTTYQAGDSLDNLFNRVDRALYLAKENSRNNVQTVND
ncbi:sensor domain-containing diguanylate cyclase [Thiomicrorhabdus cannonii]|uniref:sensor domain-containing diguanylate cyclase n=1 Tax=Thiomicrorhabdus cannonii TaxID=2748011 RepID=UPI0015BD9C89|nr:sensor domain-containing diguanylate cyclase [Thiomicrorhabdus cannonii]